MVFPTFAEENELWGKGFQNIAGVDEVGRGAFAGPVVTAAVILDKDFVAPGIADSKLLPAKKREEFADIIKKKAKAYVISEGCLDCINKKGIGKTTQQAFANSIKELHISPDFILIDAFYIDSLDKRNQKPIIKGDQKSISIAAASIIAKVYRDALMRTLHRGFENYNFAQNKGYGTLAHRKAIKEFGLSKLHRKSFSYLKTFM